MGGGGAAVAVAAAAAKIGEIVQAFKTGGATSMYTAKSLSDLRLDDSRMFRSLVDDGSIKTASPGTYYFDEPFYQELMRRRRMLALTIGLFALIAVLILAYIKNQP